MMFFLLLSLYCLRSFFMVIIDKFYHVFNREAFDDSVNL